MSITKKLSLVDIDSCEQSESVEIGQWFWVNDDNDNDNDNDNNDDVNEKDRWFGCVVDIGSNYVELESHNSHVERIHANEFWKKCKPEPNYEKVIKDHIELHRNKIHELMHEVQELTKKLGIAPSPELGDGSETRALVTLNNNNQNMHDYKLALIEAQKEKFPNLFNRIQKVNEAMVYWLKAPLIAMRAQASEMTEIINQVEDRIFNVELYAGLTEEVVKIADGKPAKKDEKIQLMQRMCYMDEECLAQYEVGGMEFKDIDEFDEWLTRPQNRDRILPFERCIVSFKVRRKTKLRDNFEIRSLWHFIQFHKLQEADKSTFLYLRNGQQIYRLSTSIEFGEQLFPDLDREQLKEKLWALTYRDRVEELITDGDYQAIRKEDARKLWEWRKKVKEKEAIEAKGEKLDTPWGPWDWRPEVISKRYTPFDKSNIFYDDIAKKIEEDIKYHNRIALVIQGLLDRSPVFSPHPTWNIWMLDGFQNALELIYDDSRALIPGDAPNFEAYRTKLNESLTIGSITIGQEEQWERKEAEKECKRLDKSRYGRQYNYRPKVFRPYGNPGPGLLARVVRYDEKKKTCTYEWYRERLHPNWYKNDKIKEKITIKISKILNVDAYKPGDFKKFFNDPRTRADYIQWAPLLLEAEEYHAGNRKVGPGKD
jgi:hypothetical protein